MSLPARGGALVAALLLALPGTAAAALPEPTDRCRIDDARLDELSGLASDGRSWFAVNDSGSRLEVYVLDPADCSVRDVRKAAADPRDVEDLALGGDGTLWLADIGDNGRDRDDVVLHAISPNGKAKLYRLTYPNGPHDAEALLLDRSGVPYIVTKEPFGPAGVYRPAGELSQDQSVPLERVASVSLRSTRTPGGPLSGTLGSVLVTGGAVSHDGTAVAIRTYTEAYLFHAPDGDVAAALNGEPVQIPLPNEPQGEALAWEPDGTLLSATEGEGQPVRALAGAAEAATGAVATSTSNPSPQGGDTAEALPPPPKGGGFSNSQLLIVGIVVAGLVVYVSRRARRNR